MYANFSRTALVLPAAAFVWYGDESPLFVITALGVIACNRFFLAGMSASLPHVVEESRLVTANSFATTAGTVTYALGLISAAAVFGYTGTGLHSYAVVSATAAIAYAASAGLLSSSFRSRDLGPDHPATGSVVHALRDTARGMVAGFRHLARRRAAAALMTAQAVHRLFYGVLALTTLLLYRNFYAVDNMGASLTALLPVAAAGAAGSLLAAVLTPGLTRRLGGAVWVTILMAGLAVLMPALGLPYLETLTVAASFVISLATQGTKIVTDTALQQEIEDDYRGRVFSINDTTFNLSFVLGLLIGALVLPPTGHLPAVMVAVGIGYAALATWYGLTSVRRPAQA
jgi:hypothetical protein